MELWDQRGDLFTIIRQVNNIYLMELKVIALSAGVAAWMDGGRHKELTHQELVGHLEMVTIAAS